MTELDRDALDRWITGGNHREYPGEAWCHNEECDKYGDIIDVTYVSEYGGGWIQPADCPSCGEELSDEKPEDVE